MRNEDLYYWEGEKPPPLTIRYEDDDGNLDDTIAGATLTAKTKIDQANEVDVTMTNNDDGTATIDWPTGTSVFVLAGEKDGVMRVDIEVADSPLAWFLPRFSFPVKKRT
jgi:hypothetical protein